MVKSLEEHLNSPEIRAEIAEEMERMEPLNRIRELHGDDWMDEEQAEWEAE